MLFCPSPIKMGEEQKLSCVYLAQCTVQCTANDISNKNIVIHFCNWKNDVETLSGKKIETLSFSTKLKVRFKKVFSEVFNEKKYLFFSLN